MKKRRGVLNGFPFFFCPRPQSDDVPKATNSIVAFGTAGESGCRQSDLKGDDAVRRL